MKANGTTFIAYGQQNPALLAKLAAMGITAQRAISHNQSTHYMLNKFWPHEFLEPVRALKTQFPILFDTLNDHALPHHGPSWNKLTQDFDPAIFAAWLAEYIPYMAAGRSGYNLVWGNEPDAVGSIYLKNESAFRARYAMIADAVAVSRLPIGLGAGGFCCDWERAIRFAEWSQYAGVRLDFVDIHNYGDPKQLYDVTALFRARAPNVKLIVLESGADWRDNSTVTPAAQAQWYTAMAKAVSECGVSNWHIHFGWATDDKRALSLMTQNGTLTPIGELVARDKT